MSLEPGITGVPETGPLAVYMSQHASLAGTSATVTAAGDHSMLLAAVRTVVQEEVQAALCRAGTQPSPIGQPAASAAGPASRESSVTAPNGELRLAL